MCDRLDAAAGLVDKGHGLLISDQELFSVAFGRAVHETVCRQWRRRDEENWLSLEPISELLVYGFEDLAHMAIIAPPPIRSVPWDATSTESMAIASKPMTFDAKVLTVSESVSRGTREDRSGDELARLLAEHGFRVVERKVVADGVAPVAAALVDLCSSFVGLVVTTGGTGFSPGDLTPEATRSVIDREAPGLAEAMRAVSPLGRLSRGLAGTVGPSLVLNVPGSPRGATESLEAVIDVLSHALDLLAGGTPH